MRWITCGALAIAVGFSVSEELPAQAIVEYGRQLGGVNAPAGTKAAAKAMRGGGGKGAGESAPLPPLVVPAAVSVKQDGTFLYAQQDEHSARVEEAQKGAVLTTMGQATANGEKWYMVRSPQGTIGWVKAVAVDEASGKGQTKSSAESTQGKKSQ